MAIGKGTFFQTLEWTRMVVKDVEFLKSRKKHNRNCMEDWKVYDESVLKKHIEKNGCVAPYHMPYNSYLMCRNQTELKKYLYELRKVRETYSPPACHRISKISTNRKGYSYRKEELKHHSDLWLVSINYENHWIKIIQQSKEVDIHSLIGNIGGYVGLFLGTNVT